jgi:DUF3068 family protein
MRRTIGIIVLVLGVVFVAGAGVVRWVVAPNMAQLPSDTNTTRMYDGTAAWLINPSVATGTRVGPGLLRNVPIQLRHTDRVVDTNGHSALVADERVVTVPGYTVADLKYLYGVDRRTFMPVDTYQKVVPASGVTFNWPMYTKPHDYTGWVQDTMMTTPLRYVATTQRGGVETYEFRTDGPAFPITDPVLGRMLPKSMTKAQLLELTPSLGLSTPQLLKLDKLMKSLPDPVPMSYRYRGEATFWVAPTSGLIVDMTQRDIRTSGVMVQGKFVPLAPLMDMTYSFTPQSVASAAADADKAVSDLHKIKVTLPVALLVLGGIFIVVGIALLLIRRRGRHADEPEPVTPEPVDDETLEKLLAPHEPIGV